MKKVFIFLFLVNVFNFVEFGKCDLTDEDHSESYYYGSYDYTDEDDGDVAYNNENKSECDFCGGYDGESEKDYYSFGCDDDSDCGCNACESEEVSSCEGTNNTHTTEPTSETSDCDDAYTQLISVITEYGMKFLKEAMKENPVKTITLSPWKICQFLGWYYKWVSRTSELKKELNDFFKIKDQNKLYCAILRATEYENNIKSGLFYGGNLVAVNDDYYTFTENAVEEFKEIDYKTFEVNFNKSSVVATVDTLNEYLNTETKSLVGDVIPYNAVNSSTKFLIAEALYSKITLSVISTGSTVKKDFICAKFNLKEINYVSVTAYTEYIESEELKASVISFSLPNDYRTVIIRPNTTFGASNVLDNIINNPEALDKALKNMNKEYINMTLPGTTNLTKLFDGYYPVKKFVPAFFEDNNYLKGLVNENKPISVTNGYQKIKLERNLIETKTSVRPKSEPKMIELKYPFIYSIYYGDINFYTGIFNGCDD